MEVVRGEKKVKELIYEVASRANHSICSYAGAYSPAMITESQENYDLMRELHSSHDVKVRYITEITKENIQYCKRMMSELSAEIKHVDNVRGNFTVTDSEYISVPATGEGKIARDLIYSNLPELVEQNQFFFETLWSSAIPAEERIRELQEGKIRSETSMVRDQHKILEDTKRMVETSNRYSVCSVSGGLLYAYNNSYSVFKEILDKHRRGEHEGIKWLTTIDVGSVEVAKKFLELGMEIRHTNNIPTESFGVSDKEVGVTLSRLEGGRLNNRALFSNEPIYLEHYRTLFESLWAGAIDVRERIKQIDLGIEEPLMRILRNKAEIEELYVEMINEAKEEILLLLPSSNAYRREKGIGVIDAMQSAVSDRGIKVFLLSPDASPKDAVQTFNREQNSKKEERHKINHKVIREATTPNTVTILVVDRTRSLIIEQQDDSKLDFEKAIGLATYSTRGSTVKSNIRFFERMWEEAAEREREEVLLQKEIRSRREAELLQDILAHDIRNFNQISLTSAELLKTEKFSDAEAQPLIDEILGATERSSNLIEKAKSLGKIISQENVKLFPVNLQDSLQQSIQVVAKAHRDKVVVPLFALTKDAYVLADDFLDDAFTNVLGNAINYTEAKTVPIEISAEEVNELGDDHKPVSYYRVAIADHGRGIPDAAKERVFTRYLETARGSGLGLSIVYALVVDRYSGKVKVRNRVEDDYRKGTVIELWLPKPS